MLKNKKEKKKNYESDEISKQNNNRLKINKNRIKTLKNMNNYFCTEMNLDIASNQRNMNMMNEYNKNSTIFSTFQIISTKK